MRRPGYHMMLTLMIIEVLSRSFCVGVNVRKWFFSEQFWTFYAYFQPKLKENCPTKISSQLPKVTLDKVYLYDSLTLLGNALSNITVTPAPVPCRKRNGQNAIWSQGGAIARTLKQFDQTVGLSGRIRIRQTGARSNEELLIYEFANQSFSQLGTFNNESIRYIKG